MNLVSLIFDLIHIKKKPQALLDKVNDLIEYQSAVMSKQSGTDDEYNRGEVYNVE